MTAYPPINPAVILRNRWKGELRYFLFAGIGILGGLVEK